MTTENESDGRRPKPLTAPRKRLLKFLPRNATGAEIGVWLGAFSRPLIDATAPAKLYLIDAWQHFEDPRVREAIVGRNSQETMEAAYRWVLGELKQEIARGQVDVRRGRSAEMIAGLPDASLDFAYVDADHSYEGVSADIEALWTKMKSEALIGFDDYGISGWWKDGVVRAVNELIARHPTTLRVEFKVGSQILLRRFLLE